MQLGKFILDTKILKKQSKLSMLLLRVLVLLAITLGTLATSSVTFPGLQLLLDFFNAENATHRGKTANEMTPEELGPSIGQCNYTFLEYVSHRYRVFSAPDDRYIQHLLPQPEGRPPLYVNCIQPDPRLQDTNNTLIMPQTVPEILELLQPHGNNTKRTEPGRCVLIYFYIPSCLFSVAMSSHVNVLPLLFPKLQFAAIDVQKFPQFTTEFGIVGVPSFMLFHQGKAMLKYMHKGYTFPEFITRHTRIKGVGAHTVKQPPMGPLVFSMEPQSNWVLHLAWWFIIICAGYHFGNSAVCKSIMEMIKRNWRESSEQMAQ